MRQLSAAGLEAIEELSRKHGFSSDAVLSMLDSVILGNSQMAQFQHQEFGGSGQWMRGGMIMISDMFNNSLKARVDGLCWDLVNLVSGQPDLIQSGSFQSQSQSPRHDGGGQQQQSSGHVSLFVAPVAGRSHDWWGIDLGQAASVGSQNNVRYAYFPQTRRLAVEVNGKVTVYDTLDHHIGGFSQQQSYGASLTFTSQNGLVEVSRLPVVSLDGAAPQATEPPANPAVVAPPAPSLNAEPPPTSVTPERPHPAGAAMDIFATIEKLADLYGKGILTADEFASKKTELLSRL